MVETKEIRNEITEALNKILVNENPEILIRKVDNIIKVCEEKKKELRNLI